MIQSLFNSLARSSYLSLISHSFNFTLWSAGTAKSTNLQIHFFIIIIRSGRLVEIWWCVCISKSQRNLCVSFTGTYSRSYIYRLFVWSNFNFLHNSQLITLPTWSCLVLYSFFADLLNQLLYDWSFRLFHHLTYICSFIIRLIISSLSPLNLHLQFYCVLSILALIRLVFIALFYAAFRRDLVSFLRFPFLSVYSCEMLLVRNLKRP